MHVAVHTTKNVAETLSIPFKAASVADSARPKGTSAITTTGVKGVETKTWTVIYSDGKETGRKLKSDVVTKAPVTQVTSVGTYVAPAPAPAPAQPSCTNGSYVNSAGATVCRPAPSSGVPAGATARCVDGEYSYSQSRRGTCSGHGGVAEWL